MPQHCSKLFNLAYLCFEDINKNSHDVSLYIINVKQ